MRKVILLDVPVPERLEEQLAMLEGIELIKYDGARWPRMLWNLLSPHLLALPDSLCVWVEGSGEDAWRLVETHLHETGLGNAVPVVGVFSKRIVPKPGQKINGFRDPYWVVGEIPTPRFLMPQIQEVILLDDVISSGTTVRKLRERNAWKFPNATWRAVACVGRAEASPKMPWEVLHLVESPGGKKVPINSLSTLLRDRGIAENYAQRNFSAPEHFLQVLSEIRSDGEAKLLPENLDV